jgi:uncharacterized protein YkwD
MMKAFRVAADDPPQRPTTNTRPTALVEGGSRRSATRTLKMSIIASVALLTEVVCAATVHADNKRLNDSVVANVYTVQRQGGCTGKLTVDPQLRQAAQWHADDLLADRSLDGDIGSDGTSGQDRARAAGFRGIAAETVAINPALAINNVDIINQWYYRPDYMAIMSNCAYTRIGVWSENSLDRSVAVAVYGQPE